MSSENQEEKKFLQEYNIHEFDIPLTSVDIVIFTIQEKQPKTLLIFREDFPEKGKWALPGGFIDLKKDKTIQNTALRKLEEKTGVQNLYLEQVETIGGHDRDPRGWSVTVIYYALVNSESIQLEKENTQWFPIDELPNNLAFDHQEIIHNTFLRLQKKVGYTALPIHLLPKEFTLTELQEIFEIILGRSLDKSAFRKRIREAQLEKVEGKFKKGSNRPAQLYCASKQTTIFYSRNI
ncbi:MAG: 8-oxo-dGTP diphosphatase [bacterium]|jgi:8-oxo-dGTP diphosphatase